MRSTRQNSHKLQFALAVCAALMLFDTPAQANTTLTLGGDPNQIYQGINVGPYPASIGGASGLLVFCLNEGLTASFNNNPSYVGETHAPATQIEEEAGFLAAYSLFRGAPSPATNIVNEVEGPISMAIWQIMGQLGNNQPDPKALPYVQLAESAYRAGLITPALLSSVQVFIPSNGAIQPFITAVRNDAMILSAIPEPGTWIFLVSGIGMIALGCRLRV